ncbi:hypothetical protein GWI33_019733 [Rhynchophorus ferrugineus]|uniref:Uncharacterized protein n=1 Tax=Rhynchophorus ferrugineus TaxID=354439 RepID=A0A834HTT7_RHYFE|nr:hypothetical protein GWI33_019733 [Rhynchophorus ferrugineus]
METRVHRRKHPKRLIVGVRVRGQLCYFASEMIASFARLLAVVAVVLFHDGRASEGRGRRRDARAKPILAKKLSIVIAGSWKWSRWPCRRPA